MLKRYDRGHLRLMKSHGGRWDAGSRMWCFPNSRRPEVRKEGRKKRRSPLGHGKRGVWVGRR